LDFIVPFFSDKEVQATSDEKLTEVIASCRFGLGFLLAEAPNRRFMFKVVGRDLVSYDIDKEILVGVEIEETRSRDVER
jgi:hypothetical protein